VWHGRYAPGLGPLGSGVSATAILSKNHLASATYRAHVNLDGSAAFRIEAWRARLSTRFHATAQPSTASSPSPFSTQFSKARPRSLLGSCGKLRRRGMTLFPISGQFGTGLSSLQKSSTMGEEDHEGQTIYRRWYGRPPD